MIMATIGVKNRPAAHAIGSIIVKAKKYESIFFIQAL